MNAIATDFRQADLSEQDRGMLEFAIRLTRHPESMTEADVIALRDQGFSDAGIHDIVQVTALFNYYNRLADGLGIELESD